MNQEFVRALLPLLILMLLFAFVSAAEQFLEPVPESIGDKAEVTVEVDSGALTYKQYKDKTLIGYELAFKDESYIVTRHNYTSYNASLNDTCNYIVVNESLCDLAYNVTLSRSVVNDKANGAAIYSYGSVKALEYNSKKYNFNEKHCWICGTYIACLSDKDGGSSVENRAPQFKCMDNHPVIRSGETGVVKNLQTNTVTIYDGGSDNVDI